MYRIVLTYHEQLIRQAVFGFWWRVLGIRFFLALALMATALIFLIREGDTSWFVGALASGLVLGVAFIAALYFFHFRNALHKLKAMGSPQATLDASDASLSISSGAGTAVLPWSAVTEIWQLKTCWLLLFSKAHFVTLPLTHMTPDAAAFILARVRAAGGKVG